jgi:hypothetical protein
MRAFAAHSSKSLLSGTLAKPLPQEILNRPKTGFTTLVNDWMACIMDLPRGCDVEQCKQVWLDRVTNYYQGLMLCQK